MRKQADGAKFHRQCQIHRSKKKQYLLVCQLSSLLRSDHNSRPTITNAMWRKTTLFDRTFNSNYLCIIEALGNQ